MLATIATIATVPGCVDCIADCNVTSCGEDSECTEQCHVVSCEEASSTVCLTGHCETCDEPCPHPCLLESNPLLCDGGESCSRFQDMFDCCIDYDTYSLNCKSESLTHLSDTGVDHQNLYSTSSSPGSSSHSEASTPILHTRGVISNPPLLYRSGEFLYDSQNEVPSIGSFNPAAQEALLCTTAHRCRWENCCETFTAPDDLISHVNSVHLWNFPSSVLPSESHDKGAVYPASSGELACLWDHCTLYPNVASIPGSSLHPDDLKPVVDLLTSHLIEDHLGLQRRALSPVQEPLTTYNTTNEASTDRNLESKQCMNNSPPCVLNHGCHWECCNEAFPNCEELHSHISLSHVGSGKTHYSCHWEGCNRRAEQSFTSKQKIQRHIQSHTGHRPFHCKMCGQYFSEAATLQQHMRRHTQEKPYVCDYPDCGKAFAIMGALTIHKRTHNGEKPFKCTYCDRGFSESSNLSKHLRTHTGAKPYECKEPGCGKRFARPDQLNRHANVHRKAVAIQDPGQR